MPILLEKGKNIILKDNKVHYLVNVLRIKIDDVVLLFNKTNGEFLSRVINIKKNRISLQIEEKIRDPKLSAIQISLAFAPVKNISNYQIARQATECGIYQFCPIITRHTHLRRLNYEKFDIAITEAIQQSEQLHKPSIQEIITLEEFLQQTEKLEKKIIFCDEKAQDTENAIIQCQKHLTPEFDNKNIVVLVGPEGGFATQEVNMIRQTNNVIPISLGNNILRVDTAIVSVLSLVNLFLMMNDFCSRKS